jgi:Retroviral aspartyl protease
MLLQCLFGATRTQRRSNKPEIMNLICGLLLSFDSTLARVGKAKPVMVKALLDSGASVSLITEKYTKKLKKQQAPQGWSNPEGELNTNKMVKSQFTMPELQDDKLIEWNLYATKDLGNYNMIIGRDVLQFLRINIQFSTQEVVWDYASMPFKDFDATAMDSYNIEDPDGFAVCFKTPIDSRRFILDAKYIPAALEKLCQSQAQLQQAQQKKLLELLQKHAALFDGTLGLWKDTEVSLELKEGAKPYHARAYPVRQCHSNTLRAEVERLWEIGVIKRVNRSEWGGELQRSSFPRWTEQFGSSPISESSAKG